MMLANYGYSDGSGSYFITIATDDCDGCGDCADACPTNILEVVDEDPNDPMREEPVVIVQADKKKRIQYECELCKPVAARPPLPCVEACPHGAISHSW